MEYWLGTETDKIRFPIAPKENGINRSADIGSENIIKFGEVSTHNGIKLKTTEISSFFPNRVYSFCEYKNFISPWEFIEKIESWMYNEQKLRFIVTGTPTNLLCKISDFNTKPQKGTGDIDFELSLIEHKDIEIPRIYANSSSNNNRPTNSSTNNKRQVRHKVVKGDNLWDISQRYYGNGKLYPKIKDANKNVYPCLKTSNVIYPYMTLLIP